MNRDFENGFGQDDDRIRSRRKNRDTDGDFGADSNTPIPRRPGSGPDNEAGGRVARQGGLRDSASSRQRPDGAGADRSRNQGAPSGRLQGAPEGGSPRASAGRTGGVAAGDSARASMGRTGGVSAGDSARASAGRAGGMAGGSARASAGRSGGMTGGGPGGSSAGRPGGVPAGDSSRASAGRAGGAPAGDPSRASAGRPGGVPAGDSSRASAGRPGGVPAGDSSRASAGRPGGVPGGASARASAGRPGGIPAGSPSGRQPGRSGGGPSGNAAATIIGGARGQAAASSGRNGAGGSSPRRSNQDTSERRTGRDTGAGDRPGGAPKKHYRALVITLVVLEFLIIIPGIFAARQFMKKYNMLQRDPNFNIAKETNPNLNVEKVANMKGYWTVALFGVDSRNNSVGKGNNADVIIIANVNQENGEIKLVSIFRDSYLSLDDQGSYNKINQAYFRGGPEMAIKALNKNLDIQIDDYATFNWKAVADAINILGGVDVDLTKAEFYYINAYITETVEATGVGSHQLKSAGPNHLDGVQAVAYARLRKMDTDFARTERQRKIIQECFDKLKKADFSVINNVMEVVFKQILTSVTLDDIIPAAKNLTKYNIVDTIGFPMQRSDANMGKKGDCVIPQTLESNVIALHKFLYNEDNYQPSDMVKKISAKISADTGLYKEGKYIDHVGTDGGYIPKPTQSTTKAAEETTESGATKESSATSGEGIIDGEYPWDLETDENGDYIDPPESGYPGGYPGSNPGYPGYPGTTQPSGNNRPGESTSPSAPYPGYPTSPSPGSNQNRPYPGASTSPGDGTNGPGVKPTAPGGTYPTVQGNPGSPGGGYPSPGNPGGSYPGNPGNPGSTNPTAPGNPGGTKPVAPGNPGSTTPGAPGYPGSTNPTTSAYPGSTGGNTSPYPGGATEGYVPDGPGSVIIGPGN